MDKKLIKSIEGFKNTKNTKLDLMWLEHFYELLEYKQTYGSPNVPNTSESFKKLSHWVKHQRSLYAKERLDPVRKALLKQIGFIFSFEKQLPTYWDTMFNKLVLFKEEFGLSSLTNKKAPQLYAWLTHQRMLARKGKLNKAHHNKLQTLGDKFGRYASWDERFEQLVKFKEQHGHLLVRRSSNHDKQLFYFVDRMRQFRSKLTTEQIQKLNSIGFWETSPDMRNITMRERILPKWQDNYEKMKAFKEKHGHCQIPWKNAEYQSLGYWVSKERYNKNLSGKKRKLLEELGVFDNTPSNIWNKKFEQLVEFKKQYGHLYVCKTLASPHLVSFVKHLRRIKDKLGEEQIRKLGSIGFIWIPDRTITHKLIQQKTEQEGFSKQWMKKYKMVVDYKKEHGALPLSLRPRKEHPLYNWIQRQKKNKNLSEEKRKLLEYLGVFEDKKLIKWEQRFAQLVEFKEQFGHTLVCRTYTNNQELINFVNYLRHIKNSLSQDRIDKLNSIKFTWKPDINTIDQIGQDNGSKPEN